MNPDLPIWFISNTGEFFKDGIKAGADLVILKSDLIQHLKKSGLVKMRHKGGSAKA